MIRLGFVRGGIGALMLLAVIVPQPAIAASAVALTATDVLPMASGTVINVPGDAATIQAGVNLATNGDVVRVAPGTYYENVVVAGKTITLASHYYGTNDPAYIDATVIDGGGITGPASVVEFAGSVGPETTIIGFHVQNIGPVPDGERLGDGIMASAPVNILYNHVTDSFDGLEFKTHTGGLAKGNLLELNIDDGIDLNRETHLVAEQNEIRFNGGDGVEMRMNEWVGSPLVVIFRENFIHDNNDDGIQLIDYDGLSNRTIIIERNLIVNNDQAGVGIMGNKVTVENYEGFGNLEPVFVTNNTFVGNNHGVTGGANLTARNNIFVGHVKAVKNIAGGSSVTHSLFWDNGTDNENSNVDLPTTLFADPLFDGTYHLLSRSPAIDAGADVGFPFNGSAPDLGAFETAGVPPPPNDPPIANNDTATTLKANLVALPVSANDTDPDGNLDPTSVNVTCGTCANPTNGVLTNLGSGSFTYTPAASFVGVDSFVYEICDTELLCDTATATVTVTAPVIGNTAPSVVITGPANGTILPEGIALVLTGTAADAEDGNLTGALKWSSSLDGPLPGTGGIISVGLSVGTHVITASVTDSGSLSGAASIRVTVTAPVIGNTAPAVVITGPADGTILPEGIALVLTGTAADAEDGNLTGALKWSSSLDGSLPGTGGNISVGLSVGTHVITASVTDSGSLSGAASITVEVQGASPPSDPDSGLFTDDDGSAFEASIEWLANRGITKGCNPPTNTRFCPDEPVTRGQMAAFLVRAMGYTDDGGGDLFSDDDGSMYAGAIDKLATAGITKGCNPPANTRFCPDEPVTRGQMAAFLVRAMGYTDDGGGDLFIDDDNSIFRTAIDRLGTAGVTRGCNPPTNDRFCPDGLVTRGEMAAFLRRALGG